MSFISAFIITFPLYVGTPILSLLRVDLSIGFGDAKLMRANEEQTRKYDTRNHCAA